MCIIELFLPRIPLDSSAYTGDTDKEQDGIHNNPVLIIISSCLILCAICVSAANVVFGLVSWTILPRWRTFRHYAFVNILLANSLRLLLLIIPKTPHTILMMCFFIDSACIHWLTVITVMFYIEFVKVFNSVEMIEHVYIKANLFGWVMPVAWTLFEEFYGDCGEVYHYLFMVMAVMNIMVYLNVLWVLCRSCKDHDITRVILSTFALIATGIVWCFPMALRTKLRCPIIITSYSVCYFLTMLSISVFFLMLKAHRELWREHRLRVKSKGLNKPYFGNLRDVVIAVPEINGHKPLAG